MIPLLIVLRVIAAFNHTHERAGVLTRDARIPDFAACWKPERSQMYFQPTAIRFASPETIEVEARGVVFGMYGERVPATFVLKKEGADWKIDSLQVFDGCLGPRR